MNKIKCVQCGSENIKIEEIETELWLEEKIFCMDCGAQMTEDGEGGYIYHIEECDNWLKLFAETLRLPIEAEVYESQDDSYISEGDKVVVHELLGEDDLYGVIVTIKKENKKYSFPLVDLEPLNPERKVKNLFDAYHDWFANGKW